MMSAKEDTSNTMMCCASCGKAECDGTQLRTCTACKSVRYCGVTCQRNHRPKHKKACKKRAAELRDEILFKQPESTHYGDCPICLLPIPVNPDKSGSLSCCSTRACKGCIMAYINRERNQRLNHTCPFCRDAIDPSGGKQKMMKRVQANDPIAMYNLFIELVNEGKFMEGLHLLSKAAELGDADAHYYLSALYRDGGEGDGRPYNLGVNVMNRDVLGVERDEKKQVYHLEEATIGGHAIARYDLGVYEWNNGRNDRAVKHWIIASNLGCDKSMGALKECYKDGLVSKEDFASALRAHHAAVDATKSPQRDAAEPFIKIQREMLINRDYT